jgi:hypothetical protein
LQTGEAVFQKAVPPLADGMAVTVQLGSDLHVGGVVGVGRPQDQAAAKDQGLGRGTGAGQAFQALPDIVRQQHGAWQRHG